jgi:hypothetical protein
MNRTDDLLPNQTAKIAGGTNADRTIKKAKKKEAVKAAGDFEMLRV